MNPILVLYFALGLALGAWHFGSLRWLSRQLVDPEGPPRWGRLAGLHLLRLGLLGGACWATARQGAPALLALGLGLLLARQWWVVRAKRGLAGSQHRPQDRSQHRPHDAVQEGQP